MKREFFAREIVDQVKTKLKDGDVSIDRMRAIAHATQDLVRRHGREVPNEAILEYLGMHPEVEGKLVLTMEDEDQEARDATIEQIRELLKLHKE